MNTTLRSRRTAVLVTLLLSLICPIVQADTKRVRSCDGVVDDRALRTVLEEQGASLIASGRASRIGALRKCFNQRSCILKLPSPHRSRISAEAVMRNSRSSSVVVARLVREDTDAPWSIAPASGFFITDSGVFVTSYHVIDRPDQEWIVVMAADGRVAPVERVLAADPESDVAILQATIDHVLPLPLQVGALIGSHISVISHPVGRFYTFTEGIVTRRSLLHSEGKSRELLEISAEFGPGSSGAPVVNDRGNVVGWIDTLRLRPGFADATGAVSPSLVFRECGVTADVLKLIQRKPTDAK